MLQELGAPISRRPVMSDEASARDGARDYRPLPNVVEWAASWVAPKGNAQRRWGRHRRTSPAMRTA